MHRKVYINVSPKGSDDDNKPINSLTCSSSVLAAQIKKIMPNKHFDNRISSISFSMDKLHKNLQKKRVASSTKNTAFDLSKMSVRMAESQMKEKLLPKTQDEAVDPEIIKMIPVPLSEKRLYRDNLSLPPEKMRWSTKIKEEVKWNYKQIYSKFELWQDALKEIEGYYGAGIVSYFHFLRWLLLMNCIILLLNFTFLTMPGFIASSVDHSKRWNSSEIYPSIQNLSEIEIMKKPNAFYRLKNNTFKYGHREFKVIPDNDKVRHINGTNSSSVDVVKYCHNKYVEEINTAVKRGFIPSLQNFLQGTGWMEPTYLFLGTYPEEVNVFGMFAYNMPLAFILIFITISLITFIMMMQFSSFGIKEALMTETDFTHNFAAEIFSAWDYCIRDGKSAALHHKSFTNGIKCTLSEIYHKKEHETRSFEMWIKLYSIRFLVHVLIILWITGCYVVINELVAFQLKEERQLYKTGLKTFIVEYLPIVSVTAISSVSPILFSYLVLLEKYHIRTEINISLTRNVFVGLSSVFVLVASFHRQITCEPRDICGKGEEYCNAPRCWETHVGQALYRLNITEFFASLSFVLLLDMPRNFLYRKFNNKYTRLIGSPKFFLPTEVLNLIYLQTICWLGVFYAPLIPVMLVIKLWIMFYLKKMKILKFTIPATTHYKASRFNYVYMLILVFSFLIVLVIHYLTLTLVRPSLGCSPFRHYAVMIEALHEALSDVPYLLEVWRTIFTGWFFVPAYALLSVLIYYYWRSNAVLKNMEIKLAEELVLLSKDRKYILQKIEELVKKDL